MYAVGCLKLVNWIMLGRVPSTCLFLAASLFCSMDFFATEVNEVSKTQGKRMLNLHGTPDRDLISLFHREAMCACWYIRFCGKFSKAFNFHSKVVSKGYFIVLWELSKKQGVSSGFSYLGSQILFRESRYKIVKLLKWMCLLVWDWGKINSFYTLLLGCQGRDRESIIWLSYGTQRLCSEDLGQFYCWSQWSKSPGGSKIPDSYVESTCTGEFNRAAGP